MCCFLYKDVEKLHNVLYNVSVGKIRHKGKTENSVNAGRLCHHLFDKEVIAMEYVYIMIYIITLIVLIITIKK